MNSKTGGKVSRPTDVRVEDRLGIRLNRATGEMSKPVADYGGNP